MKNVQLNWSNSNGLFLSQIQLHLSGGKQLQIHPIIRIFQHFGKLVLILNQVAKRLKAAPGEMERITLKEALLRDAEGTVTVELEEL